jgi:hypothetical protein
MSDDETLVQRVGGRRARGRRGRAFLTVLSGRETGALHKLGPGESVIGRATEADVQIVDHGVSRRHAKIVRDLDGTSKIVDLKSTNGTFVNGRRIEIEVLREGDRIRIGQSATLDFRYDYNDSNTDLPSIAPAPGESSGERPVSRPAFVPQHRMAVRENERTLAVREESFGPNHPAVAAVLDTLATALREIGDYQGALRHQLRALDIYEQRSTPGTEPPEMAHLLTNMGETQLALGVAADALPTLERALGLLEARRAEDIELAPVRFAIARTLVLVGRKPVRARSLAQLAREGFSQMTGGHPKLVEIEAFLRTHE